MKRKEAYLLVAFGVALYAGLMNLDKIQGALGWLAGLLTPILAGLLAAFVLSVPMNGFEKLLRRRMPKARQALLDGLSGAGGRGGHGAGGVADPSGAAVFSQLCRRSHDLRGRSTKCFRCRW